MGTRHLRAAGPTHTNHTVAVHLTDMVYGHCMTAHDVRCPACLRGPSAGSCLCRSRLRRGRQRPEVRSRMILQLASRREACQGQSQGQPSPAEHCRTTDHGQSRSRAQSQDQDPVHWSDPLAQQVNTKTFNPPWDHTHQPGLPTSAVQPGLLLILLPAGTGRACQAVTAIRPMH
jgi:hypothetical protein